MNILSNHRMGQDFSGKLEKAILELGKETKLNAMPTEWLDKIKTKRRSLFYYLFYALN